MSTFTKIQFGDGLDVTDLGGGAIRVDGSGGGAAGFGWEDVGSAGPGVGLQGFCSAEGYEAGVTSGSQHELLFTDPEGFNSNDPASFDLVGNQIQILRAGGYFVFGQLLVGSFASEASDLALIEIYDVYGTDAAGHRVNGVFPTDTPVPAIISKGNLPGAGGFAPTLQYFAFINLRDEYTYNGTRPAVWPVTIHMRMSWSASDPHSLTYSLSIMRFAGGG